MSRDRPSMIPVDFEMPNLDATNDEQEMEDMRRTFAILAHYAANKAAAIRQRKAGNVAIASGIERDAHEQYKRLPEWARW